MRTADFGQQVIETMKQFIVLAMVALLAGVGCGSGADGGGASTDSEPENSQAETPPIQPVRDTSAPDVSATPKGGTFNDSVTVVLTASEPSTIYYRLDGFASTNSEKYVGPIEFTDTTRNIFLNFIAVDTTGNQSDNVLEIYNIVKSLPPPPPKIAKVELKGSINAIKDSLGFIRYLGELLNTGDLPVCFTKIAIVSRDASGVIIDSDITYVSGSPMMLFRTISTDTCLQVGEFGAFQMLTLLKTLPASFSHTLGWDSTNISLMSVSPSEITPSEAIVEGTSSFGSMTLSGKIKNSNPTQTVSFVKLSATALNGDVVIDTDFDYITGSACGGTILTTTCLAPGEVGTFNIRFSIPSSEVTSYYYKISYDVE